MDERLLAYTAGLIDGEGYVGIQRNYGAKDSFAPVVKVATTDTIIVPFLHEHYGGWIEQRRAASHLHNSKASLGWTVRNKPKVEEFLHQIYPYLRVKKAQAEVVISYMQNCQLKKRKDPADRRKYIIDPQVTELRYAHYERIRELNRRGLHLQRLSEEAPNEKDEGEATVRTNGKKEPLEV